MKRVHRVHFLSTFLITALFVAIPAVGVNAADMTVDVSGEGYDNYTDCTDGNPATDCEYREAFRAASEDTGSDHSITLPAGVFTIATANSSGDEDASEEGDLDLTLGNNTITITGQGADSTIIDAGGIDRGLDISGGAVTGTVSINDLTIRNGSADQGGGIIAGFTGGNLLLDSVILSGNSSTQFGGGVYAASIDTVHITNTQFLNNTADNFAAGGLYITGLVTEAIVDGSLFYGNTGGTAVGAFSVRESSGTVQIINTVFLENEGGYGAFETFVSDLDLQIDILFSTFVNNEGTTSDSIASRVFSLGSGSVDVNITGSLITSSSATDDCYTAGGGTITSGGYNIENGDTCGFDVLTDDMPDTDPLSDSALEDKGGSFDVLGLQAASPAIDAVPALSCLDGNGDPLTTDIRGYTRPEETNCDIGAYEVDQTDPEVTLELGNDTIECALETWVDAGTNVVDNFDTTVAVATTEDTVDETTLGEQIVSYVSEADYDDNTGTVDRTVTVEDTTAPTITRVGSSSVTLTAGDTYNDAGATATDACDGTITGDIETVSTVNTAVAGTYSVTYNVADSSGNDATAVTRTVIVEAAPVDDDDSDVDSDNDSDTGDGDRTDDTEDTLGAVTDLDRLSDNRVRVTYEDGTTKVFRLFPSGTAKAKVQLHTNGEILIAINKKFIRTYDAFTGERLFSKKLFKIKQFKTKFKRYNIYKKQPGKNNIMVLAQTKQKQKKQFKLRAFVVQDGGKIVRRNIEQVTPNKNTKFAKLNTKKNNKNGKKARIIVTRKGKNLAEQKYRVLKKTGKIVHAQ